MTTRKISLCVPVEFSSESVALTKTAGSLWAAQSTALTKIAGFLWADESNGFDKDCWISVGLLSNQSQADSSGLDNDCGFLNAAQSTALKKIMEFCVQPSPVTKTVDFCVHCDFDKHCGFLCAL